MTLLQKLLRESARRRGWTTQSAIEAGVGLPKNRISKWLSADNPDPQWSAVVKWARAIGVPLDWLADDAQDELQQPDPELAYVLRLVSDMGTERARRRRLGLPDTAPARPNGGPIVVEAQGYSGPPIQPPPPTDRGEAEDPPPQRKAR